MAFSYIPGQNLAIPIQLLASTVLKQSPLDSIGCSAIAYIIALGSTLALSPSSIISFIHAFLTDCCPLSPYKLRVSLGPSRAFPIQSTPVTWTALDPPQPIPVNSL